MHETSFTCLLDATKELLIGTGQITLLNSEKDVCISYRLNNHEKGVAINQSITYWVEFFIQNTVSSPWWWRQQAPLKHRYTSTKTTRRNIPEDSHLRSLQLLNHTLCTKLVKLWIRDAGLAFNIDNLSYFLILQSDLFYSRTWKDPLVYNFSSSLSAAYTWQPAKYQKYCTGHSVLASEVVLLTVNRNKSSWSEMQSTVNTDC
jgi:hypothetical protein